MHSKSYDLLPTTDKQLNHVHDMQKEKRGTREKEDQEQTLGELPSQLKTGAPHWESELNPSWQESK